MSLVRAAALGCAVALAAAHGLAAAADVLGESPRRVAQLQSAEAALARGDADAALASFETAAMMRHVADTEMGIVRAHLQAGAFRRALAFCAHTAGAHRDTPVAAALYAWLLSMGGQAAFAERVLAEARGRAPDDALLAEAARQLARTPAVASAPLLSPPQRIAPYTTMLGGQAAPPPDARGQGSAVLVDAGRHALAPLSAAQGGAVWVRNGLGQTTAASVSRRLDALGLVLLRLDAPLDADERVELALRDPFAGSPGFVAAYAATGDTTPAWPWLYTGFIGAGAPGTRRLGVELPEGARGGPVFDATGRLAGIALRGDDGQDRLVPASALREALGALAGVPSDAAAPPPRVAADETYERALRTALQVLVLP